MNRGSPSNSSSPFKLKGGLRPSSSSLTILRLFRLCFTEGRICRGCAVAVSSVCSLPTTSTKFFAMSQSSATESDHSEYQLKAPSTDEVSHSLAAHNLKGSQSSDSNGPYEFDDLIYDLAEFFLAFRKIEFEEWVYTVRML